MIPELLSRTGLEPRPYQLRSCQKAYDMFTGRYHNGAGELEPAVKSILIESPVGSGKTPMGLLIALALQQERGCEVAWCAMRRNLLTQAASENAKHGIGVQAHYLSMFQHELPVELTARDRPLLLVVDEGQHDAAPTMVQLHNRLQPEFVLALSATPWRSDSVKLCFEKQISDAGIHQLIQDGYLSQYHHFSLPDWEPDTVAWHYIQEPKRWGKSLIFFRTLEECRRCLEILIQWGVRADIVTGDTDREDQIEQLAGDQLDVLINMMVLTEGFNFPDLRSVWVRDSSKGPTIQMGGRVFRQPDDRSIRFKQVVQSRKTDWPMLRTALPEQHYTWHEKEWRSLRINPLMEEISMATRLAALELPTRPPQYMLDRISRSGRVRVHKF